MKVAVALFLTFSVSSAYAQSFGSFIGKLVVTLNPDGRTMTLVKPFAYIDPSGLRWDSPSGATVDGASIPQFAWSFIGGPLDGKYRDSSVIHDVACQQRLRPWEAVHQTFYTGMRASGVSAVTAKIMYAAVYHLGPRWPIKHEVRQVTSQTTEKQTCINLGVASPVCITVPITSQPFEAVFTFDVPPPPQTLSPEAFDRLRREIENNETGETPVSLEQIRLYK